MDGSDFASIHKEPIPRETPIRFISSEYFTGYNLYHRSSVLLRRVDFGTFTGVMTGDVGPDFARACLDRFLALESLVPLNGMKKAFIDRLRSPQGAGFEELLLEAILAVETAIAFTMHELQAIAYASIDRHDKYAQLIWSCAVPRISRAASEVALLGVLELLPHKPAMPSSAGEDFDTAFGKLQETLRKRRLSPTTAVLKLAAGKRAIPCETLGRQHLLLGQGDVQRQLYSSMTSTTPIPAQKICADKRITLLRLSELRLPVPRQVKVKTLKAALGAIEKLGFPLVVKPLKGSRGGGVSAGLTCREGMEEAFRHALEYDPTVVMERFEAGQDHRLLVIGGKFVAALIRKPPAIVGDGHSTVKELIGHLNADPWRDGFRLFQVRVDADLQRMLERAGLDMGDVPDEGREVVLRSMANVSAGGIPVDITRQVHKDNRRMAERAAVGVGLDVAGVDFLTTDISRSYREVGGVIVELNARPGLCMHTWPKEGRARNVAGEVLKLFYPTKDKGRISVVAVAGDKGPGTTSRMLDMILRGAGRSVALTLRKSSFVNGVPAEMSESQQRQALLLLLRDPQVNTLVTTVSPRLVARRGLLLEECTVSVIMDKTLESDTTLYHLGLDIIERATTDCFVVGCGNTVVLDHLEKSGKKRLILVGDRPNDPVLQAHLNAGHTAVTTMWLNGRIRITAFSGTELLASFSSAIHGSRDGRSKARRLKNGKMFAIAAALGLGLSGTELKKAFNDAPDIVKETAEEATG